jgi:hypothetical protein
VKFCLSNLGQIKIESSELGEAKKEFLEKLLKDSPATSNKPDRKFEHSPTNINSNCSRNS